MSVTITCKIMRTTEKAVCVEYGDESLWLPRSQIEGGLDDSLDLGGPVSLTVSDWIAKQKNLTMEEYYEAVHIQFDDLPNPVWAVRDKRTRFVLCRADERNASIIAAALNMTEGKL